jgi:glycosyltransferase involved in cell wall biosynthesis
MRLLVVSSWCPVPAVNGAKQRARALIRELARAHEIDLLTFAEAGEEEHLEELAGWVRQVAWVRGNPHKPAHPSRWRDYARRRPRSYTLTYSKEMARRVAGALTRADLALALQIGAAVYFERPARPPRVFEEAESAGVHDAIGAAPTLAGRLGRHLTWWKYGRYLSWMARSFEATTVVSSIERDLLVSVGAPASRVHVVPNGVDLPAVAERDVVPGRLVYAGAVTFKANLEAIDWFAQHVLPLVRATHPHVQLHVTGALDGVDVEPLRRVGVRFEGHLDDVRAFLASAELAVVPLQTGGGTRLKILEAMALGVPVVSTPKGAEGLLVRDGEHLALARAPSEFAAAVARTLDDPGTARGLAAAARDLIVREYTWRAAGERLDEVLRLAAAGGGETAR